MKMSNQDSHSYQRSIEDKVQNSLIAHIFKQGNIGLGASLLSATIILIGLFDIQKQIALIIWYGVLIAIMALRFIIIEIYNKKGKRDINAKGWKILFTTGALLSGLCWGFLVSFILPIQSGWQLTFTLFIIAGMTAGSVPLLCGIKAAVFCFITAVLAPLIIRFILLEQSVFNLFAGGLTVYLVYLIVLAVRTHNMIKHSIALQYENVHLVHDLSIAKQELEATNCKLEHAARHDPLTNLANRTLFEINFESAICRAQQENKILGLLYLDIDNFKDVNDAYGHHVGDQLLQKIVERIKRKLPENVIASRLGGDELSIILENVNNVEDVAELCRKICETISHPFEINDFILSVTTSIGISIFPVDGFTTEILVKAADKAMYRCKKLGGNNFYFNTDFTTLKFVLSNSFKRSIIKSNKDP